MALPEDIRSAWLVSVLAVVWSTASAGVAIGIGVAGGSAVLVAFGAIGFIDALGSVALVYHFRHARRHDVLAAHLEHAAHRVVTVGLVAVGAGAVVISAVRQAAGVSGEPPTAGIVVAAVSLLVLGVLSTWKVAVAGRVGSPALRADGHLSRVGMAQAAVTLLGTFAARVFNLGWVDAAAAIVVGSVAIAVGITSAPDAPDVGPEGIEPSA